MINTVTLVGRLTKDPDLRYTPSGAAVARFTLAVNRTFSNAQGEREADFINCTVWRKQAENTANFLKKGSLAGVVGRIQTGSYEGTDGKRVFTTEVVAESVQFLEPKNSQGQSGQNNSAPQNNNGNQNQNNQNRNQNQYQQGNSGQQQQGQPDNFYNGSGPITVSDDDLPF